MSSTSRKEKEPPFQHRQDLLDVAKSGDIEKLRFLVQTTVVDPVSYNNNKNCLPPSLYNPALRADADVFSYLIAAHNVAGFWPRDLVSIEETFAADLNVRDSAGSSTLAMSCRAGNVKVVGYFLAKGAKLLDKDNNGDSPMMVAAREGHLDVVKLLVAHGADLYQKNRSSKIAQDLARDNGHAEVAEFLKWATTVKYPAAACNYRR